MSTVLLLWIFGTCPGTETPMNLKFLLLFSFFHASLDSFFVMLRMHFVLSQTNKRSRCIFNFSWNVYWFAVVHDSHMSWLLGFVRNWQSGAKKKKKNLFYLLFLAPSRQQLEQMQLHQSSSQKSELSCTVKKCVLFINTALGIRICATSP